VDRYAQLAAILSLETDDDINIFAKESARAERGLAFLTLFPRPPHASPWSAARCLGAAIPKAQVAEFCPARM
jgi:hypothetical protein